jgi:OOP family OmpA-OmpF porin
VKKLLLLALCIVAWIEPAYAEDWYAGVKIGQGKISYANVNNSSQVSTGVFGGMRLDKSLAIEAEYGNLGGFDSISRINKANALGLSVLYSVALNSQLSFYYKLGLAKTTLSATPQPGWILGGSTTASNTGLTYGLGVQFELSPELALRGSYDLYQVGDSISNTATAGVLAMGVLVKF